MERLKVLVCDDEAGMRAAVARTLRSFVVSIPDMDDEVGFDVVEAETGERALELIQGHPPDILLLDHKLPGMSGLDVLEEIARTPRDLLTIMITAYASIETAVRATKKGAYDFLPKPFTPAELRATIQKASRHLLVALQAKRLAAEKRRVRFEFISVLAHELKAPINAVDGYVNLLRTQAIRNRPETLEQVLDRCSVRISGMRKMINDLLDLTHIESGQKPRDIADVDVGDVARGAIDTALPEAQARGIAIHLHAAGPIRVRADRSELEIVFNNLISNAVKYNRDNGRVDVKVQTDARAVIIAVTDTGVGISDEDQRRLFRDFIRIKNEKTKDILGSGLGLSILKKIALLYDGDISVKSLPDVGSTFTVTLRETGQDHSVPEAVS
ncbi:MAG TPA: response regulator [Candidatus Hydrogenedentes bacterium]|nr:response regulator [Candidatus Hydrogenedentota bacterium]HPG66328.1 response regulator [Candidatus Hydrogenedentota bacterium]